jgi:hypothetical protein
VAAVAAKLSRKAWLEILARNAAHEAKAGNVWPLMGRVGGVPDDYLSPDERKFLCDLLEKNDGPRGKAEIKRIEKFLIRSQVEGLAPKKYSKRSKNLKAAVSEVMSDRDRSRSFIFEALKESKKPK